jgi:hypothetical protein
MSTQRGAFADREALAAALWISETDPASLTRLVHRLNRAADRRRRQLAADRHRKTD